MYPEVVDVDTERLFAIGGRREFTDNRLIKNPVVVDLEDGESQRGVDFPHNGVALDFAAHPLASERVLVAAVMCDGDSDLTSTNCNSTSVQMAIYDLAQNEWEDVGEATALRGGANGPGSIFPAIEFFSNGGAETDTYLSYTNVDEEVMKLVSFSSSVDSASSSDIDLIVIAPDPPALGQVCASASAGLFVLSVDDPEQPVVVGVDPPTETTLRQLQGGEWIVTPAPSPGVAGAGPPLLGCDELGPYLVTTGESQDLLVERLVADRLVQHAVDLQGPPVAIAGSDGQGVFVATAPGQVAAITGDVTQLLEVEPTRPVSLEYFASTGRLVLIEDVPPATEGEQALDAQRIIVAESDK